MKELSFTKMHGAGNDFVVLDGIREVLPPDLSRAARRLCDRHFGVGADQVLVARPAKSADALAGSPGGAAPDASAGSLRDDAPHTAPDSPADFFMEIYNADGSRPEMCANGIRAFLKYLRDRGHTAADEVAVETLGGVVRPRWMGGGRVRVEMGHPVLAPAKIPTTLGSGGGTLASGDEGPVLRAPLDVEGQRVEVSCVSMGNPHAVLYVDDVEAAPVPRLGPALERHPAFPNRVNVEFVQVLARDRVRQRTWERGAGETLACGSGACAVAVASILNGLTDRNVTVELRGGTLEIAWPADDAPVLMTGPAAEVFTGRIALEEI